VSLWVALRPSLTAEAADQWRRPICPNQPFVDGAVRVGEATPESDATPCAVSELLQACQFAAVLPDSAPLSRSFSRFAGWPAFLRHVAGGTPNSRLKARLKAASDS
jgi:hypothetical protein